MEYLLMDIQYISINAVQLLILIEAAIKQLDHSHCLKSQISHNSYIYLSELCF